jgi:hypothetical protein
LPSISEYPERLTNDLLDRGRIGFDVDPFKGERMGYHYVPQEYLKGFADPSNPDRLWQFDKKVQIYSKAALPIDQIAQSRDFYDAKTEDELNRLVEVPGNRVLRKLRSGDFKITTKEKAALAFYIATMIKRVPRHREKAAEAAPQALKEVTAELRQIIQSYANAGQISDETAARRIAEANAIERRFAAQTPATVQTKLNCPWPTDEMLGFIYRMSWRFVVADGDEEFITTDNPGYFFESDGLGTDLAEMTFPVSKDLAIFGSWTHITRGDRVSGRTQFVKEANRRLVSVSTRFVYSRLKFNWIPKVAVKEKVYIRRIRW